MKAQLSDAKTLFKIILDADARSKQEIVASATQVSRGKLRKRRMKPAKTDDKHPRANGFPLECLHLQNHETRQAKARSFAIVRPRFYRSFALPATC